MTFDESAKIARGARPAPVERAAPELARREVMRLLAASAALAALPGCAQRPRERILPYRARASGGSCGAPLYYATSMELDGLALGLLAKSTDGRPTKLDGNPEHPASLGATRPYEQASVLDLYEPTRLDGARHAANPVSMDNALAAVARAAASAKRPWFVMPPQSSPTLGALIERIRERTPAARFTFRSPVARSSAHAAARAVFGRPLEADYDFRRARVVLALDADFLGAMPMSLAWARAWAERRRQLDSAGAMSRLYVAETMPSPTGSVADHRFRVRPSELPQLASALFSLLARSPEAELPDEARATAAAHGSAFRAPWLGALGRDLLSARGESIVLAGDRQPLEMHVLAALANALLGNLGVTVKLRQPALLEPEGGDSLAALADALGAGEVDSLALLDVNPLYDAAPELRLESSIRRVKQRFQLTYLEDETSRACSWVLPKTHFLESWGDPRAYDGTPSSVQPLLEPFKPGTSLLELLAVFAGVAGASGHTLVREHWRSRTPFEFERLWEQRLRRGFDAGSAFPEVSATPRWAPLEAALLSVAAPARAGRTLELHCELSPSVYDGRFAHNAWLQELPHPSTKQTWGNAAVLSPATAARLGVESGRVLRLSARGRSVSVPALVLPGHADDSLTLALGYGRRAGLALGHGVNAFSLKSGAAELEHVEVVVTKGSQPLAVTQEHFDPHDRPVALGANLKAYRANPGIFGAERGPQLSLLPVAEQRGPQWAMTIDTMICTGCSSCVVACQAENNVPVVGKAGVVRSREMHWLRIERYLADSAGAPEVVNQPMLCQHCENAPCEYVCPVNATVHSPDGLNEMVYNRCIGTRFCSNNCPYKVRRFNFFDYGETRSSSELQHNPEVTVRERGVMEKCTFCVQRIRGAEVLARVERRSIRPDEVKTACQQACPTGAIQFGSLEHRELPVVVWRRDPRRYEVLHELNTRPRVQYLAKLSNPNAELGERS